MEVIFVLLPLTLLLALVAVVAFIWAVKRGQYQDLSTPAIKVLVDDHSSCSSPIAGSRSLTESSAINSCENKK